ncbi:hypothetical protein V8C40DRAFT_258590 [Trichoderma camerunense]
MEYRGNTYSKLTSEQQFDISKKLPLQCHSLETLGRNGVILDTLATNQLPESIAKRQVFCVTDFKATPIGGPSAGDRKAVAIACQVAEAEDGGNEPISICAIDFITGETLIDSFIAPSRAISNWRTNVHGISAKTIEAALKGNNCLSSWQEARTELFNYVNAHTILVGFTIRKDLEALRVFHRGIVDGQILATEAICRTNRELWKKWTIDAVCIGLLVMFIRRNATPRNQMHDPLEDALAAREIVLHFIQKPAEVAKWGKIERQKLFGDLMAKEETTGKAAKVAAQGLNKSTHRKASSNDNQGVNRDAKGNGKKSQNRAKGVKGPMSQSLKELSIEDANQGSTGSEKLKGPKTAVSKTNHTKDLSENQEKSIAKAQQAAKRKAKREAKKAAQKDAKIEAALEVLVREEEQGLLRLGNTKQSAKTDWEVKHKADRRAKWVENQRDN